MTTPNRTRKERDYLRVGEVAVMFHVSPKTVVRWAEDGKLPHIVTLGGHRRFPRASIESLVPTMTQRTAEPTGTDR
jgi:excisionase family DNA binding protein